MPCVKVQIWSELFLSDSALSVAQQEGHVTTINGPAWKICDHVSKNDKGFLKKNF